MYQFLALNSLSTGTAVAYLAILLHVQSECTHSTLHRFVVGNNWLFKRWQKTRFLTRIYTHAHAHNRKKNSTKKGLKFEINMFSSSLCGSPTTRQSRVVRFLALFIVKLRKTRANGCKTLILKPFGWSDQYAIFSRRFKFNYCDALL